MRLLYEMDTKDYNPNGIGYVRHSARCIAIRNGQIAMIYSRRYRYYKFPGGGIEPGETREDAMIRETREEAGLTVIPSSIRPYGYIHRIQKSARPGEDYFWQDNFYYLCEVEDGAAPQQLSSSEEEELFVPVWVSPAEALAANRAPAHDEHRRRMMEREAVVLELLMRERIL